MLRNEKIGDNSGGVSPACCIRGGLRVKIIDAGREPLPSPLSPVPTGESSVCGDGASVGGGVCHRGGVWAGVMFSGVTLLEEFLSSLPESLFPQLDINERTRDARGVNNGL